MVIHEIAHQWFGNAVTETTWDDAWLSEGFATFFTLLFIENEYGKDEYTKGILKAKKTVYDLSAKMPAFSIVSDRTAEKEVVTSGITYQKGAWVLHMLRNLIGEAAFKKGIQNYYATYFNANTSTDAFIVEMEKASNKDLKLFFKQWLYQPINPTINASWNYDATTQKLKIHLNQTQGDQFLFTVPVEMGYYKKGDTKPTLLTLNLKNKEQDFTFSVKNSIDKLELDPRNVLLNNGQLTKQ